MQDISNTIENKILSFEDAIPRIEIVLLKNKHKWQLHAIPSWDYQDVSQVILLHLFNKWHLYDQSKQLEPWVNTIANNQILNIRRNIYDSHSRPCLKCVYNMGGDSCEWTKGNKQDSSCPLYKKWENGKKYAHDMKVPVSMENHLHEVSQIHENDIDIERAMSIINKNIKSKLKPNEYKVYNLLFIKNLSNEEAANIMGFSCKEKNRASGYGRISQIRRTIIKKVKEITKEVDLF